MTGQTAWASSWHLGLSEVQVGLPLPPVILAALRRLVGSRHAEHLAVRGLLITPAEAAACGLVGEPAPVDQVVDRSPKMVRGFARASSGGNGDHPPASPR